MSRLALLTLPCLLLACGSKARPTETTTTTTEDDPVALPAESTTYYLGTVEVSGPDGTPYGPPSETVLSRTVKPGERMIVETVLIQGKMSATTMTQTEVENVFAVTHDGEMFTGTLTYQGPAWAWTGWDYDIAMSDGSGKLTGHAEIGATEISTAKEFHGSDGSMAFIVEKVHAVPEDEFETKRQELAGE